MFIREKKLKLFPIISFILLLSIFCAFSAYGKETFLFSSGGKIINLSGKVYIFSTNKDITRLASVGDHIKKGETIITSANGHVAIYLSNGETIKIGRGQKLLFLSIFETRKGFETGLKMAAGLKQTMNLEIETSNVLALAPG